MKRQDAQVEGIAYQCLVWSPLESKTACHGSNTITNHTEEKQPTWLVPTVEMYVVVADVAVQNYLTDHANVEQDSNMWI